MSVTTYPASGYIHSDFAVAEDDVILVDEHDQSIGFAPKLSAHQNGGKLHRAFSVFIFDDGGKMLIQQRAIGKYHFGGQWTNACCSHPRRDESPLQAAQRRLQEEFGFKTDLKEIFSFIYRAVDNGSGLTEHEYDHVFAGKFDGEPTANPVEIAAWKWINVTELEVDVRQNPQHYTPWFQQIVTKVLQCVQP